MNTRLQPQFIYLFAALFFFSAGTLGATSRAQAQDESTSSETTTAPKKKKLKKKKKKKKSVPAADATEEGVASSPKPATDKKTFELLLNAGLAPSPMLGVGGTAGLFVGGGRSAIELSGTYGKKTEDVVSIGVMYTGVRYRQSIFGAPYVAAGLGYRSVSAVWNNLSADESEELKTTSTSTSIAIELAGGAQFHLGSFAIGADVVGVIFPVSKSVKDTLPEAAYSQTDYDTQYAHFQKYNGLSLVVMKVGIGLAI
jgi:hypothetical protein